MQIQLFNTENIHCVNCEGRVKKLLSGIDGIKNVEVNVLRKTMRVEYDQEKISLDDIISTMTNAGYGAKPIQTGQSQQGEMPKTATLIPSMQEVNPIKIQSFNTENIHCVNCEGRVKKLLSGIDGIKNVEVNVLRKTMRVEYEHAKINLDDIIFNMTNAGYGAKPIQAGQSQQGEIAGGTFIPNMQNIKSTKVNNTEPTKQDLRAEDAIADHKEPMPKALITSLSFAAILMYVAMAEMLSLPLPNLLTSNAGYLALLQLILCLPILYANAQIFRSGYAAMREASPSMDTLVSLGSGSAAIFGIYALVQILFSQDAEVIKHWSNNLYFDSSGMILALIGLGKYFESKARGQASKAIDKLSKLSPSTAICLRNGQEVTIPSNEIVKGDILIVHSGTSIATDGIITQGSAFIDESLITGESLPVEKHVGQRVIGATISTSGYFQMQVTEVGDQTTLARIIGLVDDALATKAPIARLADRISAIFVPVIIGIALLSFVVWFMLGYGLEFSMSIAISVLVISCPCALGLATPTAIMVGTGMGAERGILFKSAAAIERVQSVDTVVLDKTGTLTHGKPVVTDIISMELSKDELLRMAASIERLSEHPLGKAIVQESSKRNLELLPTDSFENFTQLAGLGLTAKQGLSNFTAGNARLLEREGVKNPLHEQEKTLSALGKTVLYFTKDQTLLGLIAVADAIKDTSPKAVQDLQELGLNVLMLTGDNKITAKAVQNMVGIDESIAEVMPEEKESKIRTLQNAGHGVIMVGDGINDAPALARADVGIAIGTGTDIAMQSADVVLMQGDVAKVATAYKLSRAVMRTIKQNLFWAFAYNIVLIPVAAGVLYVPFQISLNPMFAAASMSLSSLTVVGNALRLRRQ